jgi:hypothetical protein
MRPRFFGYLETMRAVGDGLREREDIRGDELWRELRSSIVLIGVVLIAVSVIGWLAF